MIVFSMLRRPIYLCELTSCREDDNEEENDLEKDTKFPSLYNLSHFLLRSQKTQKKIVGKQV